MAIPRTVTWPLEPHTKTKHVILRGYLSAWMPIMSRTNRRIVFIDGFAGPGRYAGGDEGSPLIALRTALDHRQRDPGCEFNFLFIEEHPERAANLQREIDFLRAERPFPEEFDYEVANEKFEEKVDGLLAGLAGARLAPTRNVSMKVRQIRFAFSDSRMCRSWSFPVVALGQAEGAAAPQAG